MRIPKHYRLVNEHPHSFEMHDTRDGSKFHIAKDHIDEKMHAKIASVPKYADGGQVDRNPSSEWLWQGDTLGKITGNKRPVQQMANPEDLKSMQGAHQQVLEDKQGHYRSMAINRQNPGIQLKVQPDQIITHKDKTDEEMMDAARNYEGFINPVYQKWNKDNGWNPYKDVGLKLEQMNSTLNSQYPTPLSDEIRSRGRPFISNLPEGSFHLGLPEYQLNAFPRAPSHIEYRENPEDIVPADYKGPLEASVSPLQMPPNTVMAAEGAEITEEDAKKYGNMTTQERLEALARYTNPNITEESNKEEKYPAAEETPKTEAVKKEVPIPKVEGGEWAPMMPWHTPISDQGPAARNPAGELPPAMMERVFPIPTTGQIGAPLTEDTTMTPGTGAVPVYPPAVTTTEDRGAAYVPPGSENNIAPTGRTTLAPGMSLNAPQEAPLGVSPSGKPILGPPTEAQAGALTHTPTTTEIMQQRNAAMMQPYGEMENLIRGGINAESDYAKKANDSWQGYVADMAKRPDIASYVEQLEKKNQALATSMVQNQTNPNRLWQNMGTGSKIASAIGLMFGGIGAGMTGGTNYAMETINKAIDRDIEAQKNSRETVMNLWNMNKDLTGTKLAAELQTRQQALSAVEAQIKGYSALAGGPMAAAKAAPVLMEIQKARQDLALMQSLTSGANPGAEDSHQKMMSYMQLKNPDVYKDMISKYMPNQGTTKIPLTDNDRDAFGGYNTLEKVLNEARNFSIQEGPKMPFQEANERAKVIRNALILEANKLFKINRLNEQELGLFEGMAPNPASWFNANTIAKLNEMLHQVDAHRKVDYMKVGFIPFPEADIKQKARTWLMQNRYSTDPAIQQRVKEMQQYLGG